MCDRGYSYLVNMQGLERCPFLREVAEREGQQYAAHIACRPTVPFVRSAQPVLREDACDFAATFQLFHGPAGVVPLRSGILSSGAWLVAAAVNVAMPRRLSLPSSARSCPAYDKYAPVCIAGGGCPFHAASAGALPARGTFATAAVPAALRSNIAAKRPVQQLSPFAGSSMASLSLSFGLPVGVANVDTRVMPTLCLHHIVTSRLSAANLTRQCIDGSRPEGSWDQQPSLRLLQSGIGDWWAQRKPRQRQDRQRRQQRQPRQPPGAGDSAAGTQPGSRVGGGRVRGGGGRFRSGSRFNAQKLRSGGRFRSGNFSDSNFAKQISSLLAAGAAQELKCPAAIVAARAAVARLKPVRLLRPQALPIKLLAIGAFTGGRLSSTCLGLKDRLWFCMCD